MATRRHPHRMTSREGPGWVRSEERRRTPAGGTRRRKPQLLLLLTILFLCSNYAFLFYNLSSRSLLSIVPAAPDRPVRASTPSDRPPGRSFLWQAVRECAAAQDALGLAPAVMRQLVALRQTRFARYDPVVQMASEKLGDKVYAAAMGVRTPALHFCGRAGDLPRGDDGAAAAPWQAGDFVLKPLRGYSAQGVKVVVGGRDRLARGPQSGRGLAWPAIVDEYGSDTIVVAEELVESPRADAAGLVPPDYKFIVAGGMIEDAQYIDRNRVPGAGDRNCRRYFYVAAAGWRPLPGAVFAGQKDCDLEDYAPAPKARSEAMLEAVARLAAPFMGGNYMRVDMFDSRRGPMLGEFTPYPYAGRIAVANNTASYFTDCLQSYMFIQHAVSARGSDDARLVVQTMLNKGPVVRPSEGIGVALDRALVARVRSWIPANWTGAGGRGAGARAADGAGDARTAALLSIAERWDTFTVQEKCDHARRAQRERPLDDMVFPDALDAHDADLVALAIPDCLPPKSVILMAKGLSGASELWGMLATLTNSTSRYREFVGTDAIEQKIFFDTRRTAVEKQQSLSKHGGIKQVNHMPGSDGRQRNGQWMLEYLCHLGTQHRRDAFVGFQWKPFWSVMQQRHEVQDALQRIAALTAAAARVGREPPVVVVRSRRNPVDIALSSIKRTPQRVKIAIEDAPAFRARVGSLWEEENAVDAFLRRLGIPVAFASHDALYYPARTPDGEEEWNRLLRFVSPRTPARVSWVDVRRASRRPSATRSRRHEDLIENWEEVRAAFEGTEVEHLLRLY